MTINPPRNLLDVLSRFDAREGVFGCFDLGVEIENATQGMNCPNDDARKSIWAECAPWEFSTHDTIDGGPWDTYFQPMIMKSNDQGEYRARSDLRTATPEIIEYWGRRAEEAKHPVMKARYADLVWDATKFVTGKKPDIKYARIAIYSYLAAAALDDGTEKYDTREGLTRALQLALRVQDKARITAAVDATVAFVEKTAEDGHIGTYCYLYDNLLPPEKGPTISPETEKRVIDLLEAKFTQMTTPGGPWDVEPHSPQGVCLRLAAYYARKKSEVDRVRVLRAAAEVLERRAAIIAPMIGMGDLQRASELYVEAGLREDAERVRRMGQELVSRAVEAMPTITTRVKVRRNGVELFRSVLTNRGIPDALTWLTAQFVPDQEQLEGQVDSLADRYPLQARVKRVLICADHIVADIGDTDGDPDGMAVWRTSQHLQRQQLWLGWGFDHLFDTMGLTVDQATAFIAGCPLYEEDRLPIIRAGLQAHFDKDYLKSVHVLVPQIEKALVNLHYHSGGAAIKPHQSGRGVMQQKSINDVLRHPDDPLANANTIKALGPDLRVYLIAALSHPKGLNIRNKVCHGLWPADNFTKTASEQVLHALCAVALLRPTEQPDFDDGVLSSA
ncbi:MAG: DUF4209 domain-containing protein [Phycisphaerales bacterium]|nr:DUF4209 domain-containing protein [Phycisphaerales bacterium]